MFAIFNYDTKELLYTAHNKNILEEILMDIWEEDTYTAFYYWIDSNKNLSIFDAIKHSLEASLKYNITFLKIIKLPDPID